MKTTESKLTMQDETLLRAAIQAAVRAAAAGNHPFGAVLADRNGKILLEAENTVTTEGDPTGHAETNLIRLACQKGVGDGLEEMTLYASTEPCPMCAGAIYWGGIGRVVYGLSHERLYAIVARAGGRTGLMLACREVLMRGGRPVEVLGPALEDEAAEAHEEFWRLFLHQQADQESG